MAKMRLDLFLLEHGFAQSREQARGLILGGKVRVNGKLVDKAGQAIADDSVIEVAKPEHNYVSRGGLKLEKAITELGVNLTGKRLLDVGASTGGFTDCALQNGAQEVIALDVGTGQLDWKLRNDPRVHVMERTNIRHVTPDQLSFTPDIATIDVSFISLKLVLPVVYCLLSSDGTAVALIKPQFEAGRESVSRGKGVIRDPALHRETVSEVVLEAQRIGFSLQGLTFSPILGPEGNMEFIALLKKGGDLLDPSAVAKSVAGVVDQAHKELTTTR